MIEPPVAQSPTDPLGQTVVPESDFFGSRLIGNGKGVIVEIRSKFLLFQELEPLVRDHGPLGYVGHCQAWNEIGVRVVICNSSNPD